MSGIFLKFKRRCNAIRTLRSALVGLSVGALLGGAWLILWKLAVIGYPPISSLYIGLGSALLVGGLVFLLSGKKDKKFAEELDSKFDLKARVQTMIEYMGQDGELISIQRRDAESALSKIPLKSYKFKRLWVYLVALLLSASVLVVGIILDDVRNYVPPEEVIPFELSALQETGLNNLITYVENSDMEEEFKLPLADELKSLIEKLRQTKTQPEMLLTLDESMKVIQAITYESSTATEVLNALWNSGDIYFRHLAKTLDSSEWSDPDWGDFAEKLLDYEKVLLGDDKKTDEEDVDRKENLKFAVETMSLKLKTILDGAAVGEDDEICLAVDKLFNGNPGGLVSVLAMLNYVDDEGLTNLVDNCMNSNGEGLFAAISLNKVNANVGEYAMIRLTGLFIVPLPEFERPDFVKNGESIGSNNGSGNEENNNSNSDGGIGEGATYGSNDIVIDPLTGEYVEYGKLLDKYYAIMYEKLDNNSYTEEQKEAIKKYFALLYSGIKKVEGN